MNDKIQKQNVGNAGEYYIAARLSALNFVTTITLGRAEKYDILALSPKGKLVKMSVKTLQRENAKGFPLSAKDERGAASDFYYALVRLNKSAKRRNFGKEPDFWIIPSAVVCPLIEKAHKVFSKTHRSTTMRKVPIEIGKNSKARDYYPKNWNEKVKQYQMNLGQLLEL